MWQIFSEIKSFVKGCLKYTYAITVLTIIGTLLITPTVFVVSYLALLTAQIEPTITTDSFVGLNQDYIILSLSRFHFWIILVSTSTALTIATHYAEPPKTRHGGQYQRHPVTSLAVGIFVYITGSGGFPALSLSLFVVITTNVLTHNFEARYDVRWVRQVMGIYRHNRNALIHPLFSKAKELKNIAVGILIKNLQSHHHHGDSQET